MHFWQADASLQRVTLIKWRLPNCSRDSLTVRAVRISVTGSLSVTRGPCADHMWERISDTNALAKRPQTAARPQFMNFRTRQYCFARALGGSAGTARVKVNGSSVAKVWLGVNADSALTVSSLFKPVTRSSYLWSFKE